VAVDGREAEDGPAVAAAVVDSVALEAEVLEAAAQAAAGSLSNKNNFLNIIPVQFEHIKFSANDVIITLIISSPGTGDLTTYLSVN